MRLLLDTHVLLWWLVGDALAPEVADQIADPEVSVAVSAASVWEIAIKESLGKLRFKGSIAEQVRPNGFEPLSVSLDHAERAGALPAHHRDPFDRMLIAQAQVERLTIVTRDPAFDAYAVDVLHC